MLICVVGKTCSGKDTVAHILKDNLGIDIICSYTTRPKRTVETDGVEHYFVTKEEFDKVCEEQTVLAYTKFPETGYEYCATADLDKDWIYIINPEGLETLEVKDKTVIFVDCPEDIIIERSKNRGDLDLQKRLNGEREQFDAFKESGNFNYIITNTFDTKEDLVLSIKEGILPYLKVEK